MNINPFLVFSLTATALGAAFVPAHAQLAPPDRSDVRAQRRAMLQNMTPDQRVQYFQNQWQERYNAASPEQKAQMDAMRSQLSSAMQAQGLDPNNPQAIMQFMQNGGMKALRGGANAGNTASEAAQEAQMRAMMNASGISDKATQDPIIAFVLQRQRERRPVLQLARAVASSLVASSSAATTTVAATPSVPNSAIAQQFLAYQDALDKDKALATTELSALDKQISYGSNPRVQAFLSLVGILNPDSLALGGPAAIFAPAAPSAGGARPTSAQAQG